MANSPNAEGAKPATVVVVDDDQFVLGALDSLFRSVGYQTQIFANARALLAEGLPVGIRCLVLDVRLPEISGFEFQNLLLERSEVAPIVFMTGHGDIPMTVRAMKLGAVDFLSKPFREQDMLDAVATALERDRERFRRDRELLATRARFDSLTSREREVLQFVVAGLMNKQIAAELGLSEITVKLHRGTMMRKMAVRTVPDLVRMAQAVAPSSGEGAT